MVRNFFCLELQRAEARHARLDPRVLVGEPQVVLDVAPVARDLDPRDEVRRVARRAQRALARQDLVHRAAVHAAVVLLLGAGGAAAPLARGDPRPRGVSTAARSARCAGLALGGVGCHTFCVLVGAPGGARGRMPRKRRSQYGLKDILICCAIFAGIFITIFLIGKLWEWVQASYAKRQRRLRKEAFLKSR